MRKSPVRHRVRSHKRKGKQVRPFMRGKGRPLIQRKKIKPRPFKVCWATFNPETQQRVWMTPEEFLNLATPPSGYEFSKYSIEGIEKALQKGEPLWSLRLDVRPDGQVVGHEGRHRAFVALKRKWKEIPVVIWHENKEGRLIRVQKPFKISGLKPEWKLKGYRFSAGFVAKQKLRKTNPTKLHIDINNEVKMKNRAMVGRVLELFKSGEHWFATVRWQSGKITRENVRKLGKVLEMTRASKRERWLVLVKYPGESSVFEEGSKLGV